MVDAESMKSSGSVVDSERVVTRSDRKNDKRRVVRKKTTAMVANNTTDGRLITRQAAAELLGVSQPTIRRMEGTTLFPQIDEHGRHVFPIEQIANIGARRMLKQGRSGVDGVIAAAVFREFAAGKNDIDVVMTHEVPPERAEHLFDHWMRRRGTIVLLPEDVEQLNVELRTMRVADIEPITDSKSFITAIKSLRRACVSPADTRCRACLERGEVSPKQAVLCAPCCQKRANVLAKSQIDAVIQKDG